MALLGAVITTSDGVIVRISETEAYTQEDPASHSFRGPTPRNRVMFGPPGHLYVYFTYGMHWCANVVTGAVGDGQAVLLRGALIIKGHETVQLRRGVKVSGANLVNGPAKLCQALAITGADNGLDLCGADSLVLSPMATTPPFSKTPRIGISRGVETLWRFVLTERASDDRATHQKRKL